MLCRSARSSSLLLYAFPEEKQGLNEENKYTECQKYTVQATILSHGGKGNQKIGKNFFFFLYKWPKQQQLTSSFTDHPRVSSF